MCKFANIHNHTDVGSFDAVLTADRFVERVKELGQEYVVQTDHGTMRGMIGLAKKARKAGLKYIPAIEVYTCLGDVPVKGADLLGKRYYHMLLIAKNQTGLTNLFELNALSYQNDGHFYYKPRVTLEEIRKHSDGLIATTGCIASPLSTIALLETRGAKEFKEKRSLDLLKAMLCAGLSCDDHLEILTEEEQKQILADRSLFGTLTYSKFYDYLLGIFGDDLYGEVQDCGDPDQDIVNAHIFEYSKIKGVPVIATSDAHYARPEDARVRELMMRIRHKRLDLNDGVEFYEGGRLHLKSGEELGKLFGVEPINNTIRLVESCTEVMLERSTLFPVPKSYGGSDRNIIFKKKILEGLVGRGITPDHAEYGIYLSRIEHEFEVITSLGFTDYFLVLEDLLSKARARNILIGPGRGSISGCLIAWTLNITQVDSIKYNLLFSRFLNKHRVSLPDADIDVMSSKRDEFISLVVEEYGQENVCQIMTFLEMKPKSIARDLGRIFEIPDLGAEIAKLIPPPLHGREATVSEALEQVPQLKEPKYAKIVGLMRDLESLSRTSGVHAGGVIIAPIKLKEVVPVEFQKDKAVVGLAMDEIESAGLIKFDFLGLRNLDIINETCRMVGIEDPYAEIPLDDEATYLELTNSSDFGGFFQFEGSIGIGDLLRKIQPKSIKDISDATALYRPGPLNSGMDKEYLEKRILFKEGKWKADSYYEQILESTYGTMIYQEQLMEIVVKLAGFDEAESDLLRRAIGKKKHEEIVLMKNKFVEGCKKLKKVNIDEIEGIWSAIEKNADYGFNASHSVSYALLSYITAYLRTHYKEQYMASLLNWSKDDRSKFLHGLKSTKNLGVEIRAPQISKLEEDCVVEGPGIIRLGTAICKNLKKSGGYAVKASKENPRNLFDFIEKVNRSKLNVRACKAMISAGILDEFTYSEDFKLNRTGLRKAVEDYYEWFRLNEAKKDQWNRWNERRLLREAQESLKLQGLDYGKRLVGIGKEPSLPKIPSLKDYQDIPDELFENALAEYEILGCTIGPMPTEYFEYDEDVVTIAELKEKLNKTIEEGETTLRGFVIGIIAESDEIRTSAGKSMASLLIEDVSDFMNVTIFPRHYEKIKATIGKFEDLSCFVFDVTCRVNQSNLSADQYEITFVYNNHFVPKLDKYNRKFLTNNNTAKVNFESFLALNEFLQSNQSFVGEIIYKRLKGIKNYVRKDCDY